MRLIAQAIRRDDVDPSRPKPASGSWGAKPPPPPSGGNPIRARRRRAAPAARRGEGGVADRRSAARQGSERPAQACERSGRGDSREPDSATARPVAQPPRASTRVSDGTASGARKTLQTRDGMHVTPSTHTCCEDGAMEGVIW